MPPAFPSILRSVLLLVTIMTAAALRAAIPADFAVDLKATTSDTSPRIVLSWTQRLQSNITAQAIYRRLKGETTWGTPIALGVADTTYSDTTALAGVEYEYWMKRTLNVAPYSAIGYLSAGLKVVGADSRGTLLLLVDDTMVAPLAPEIGQLKDDLAADGWTVQQITAPRTGTAADTKALVKAAYDADPANVKMLYILGHVPVPYSGFSNPDGHYSRALPSDGYYADMDGNWTDATTFSTSTIGERGDNVAGDGKFDQSWLPSLVELQVGRVDMANLTAAPSSAVGETSLLRRYLRKAHDFRHKQGAYASIPRTTLVRDTWGYAFSSEPFAVTAWAGALTCLGQTYSQVDQAPALQWFSPTYAGGKNYLWAHLNGGGNFEYASDSGSSSDFGHQPSGAVFMSVFGSYFCDWDSSQNLMRSIIAGNSTGDSLTLSCFWQGRPNWFVHPLGMGETLGYITRLSMNSGLTGGGGYQLAGSSSRGVHLGLMGDPALRIHAVEPPRGLAGSSASGQINLTWAASNETGLQGYHVYRAATSAGPFTKLTSAPLTGTSYADTTVTPGETYAYLVRTLKLESVPGGSYYNPSVGSSVSITASGSASARPLNPSDLTIVAQTSAVNTQLTWRDNSSDETGFRVERRTNAGGVFATIATLPANATTYTDAGPFTHGNVYFYRVVATGAAGDSTPSNEVSFEAVAGFVEFLGAKTKVNNTTGTVLIGVKRYGGGVGAVTVTCTTSNYSAVAGTHYTATNSNLNWADGEQGIKYLSVPVGTSTPQLPREFRIGLSGPTGGLGLALWSSIAVLIEDPRATLDSPWQHTVLGTLTDYSPAVSAEGVIGDCTMAGALGGTADSGSFAYQSHLGDGVLTARIPSPTTQDQSASRFALMVRSSTAGGAVMAGSAAATSTANFGTKMAYRSVTNGSATLTPSADNNQDTPQWLRITRSGNSFTSESSVNGTTWTTLGTVTLAAMPETALWGLFHCSADWAVTNSYAGNFQLATYENVTLAGPPLPEPPANLNSAGATSTSVPLTWTASPYAMGYRIERRGESSAFETIATVTPGDATTYTDTTVQPDTAYQYRIHGYNGTGDGAVSAALSLSTPALDPSRLLRPGFLTVTPNPNGSNVLSWTDDSADETGFQIERHAANAPWTLLTTLAANTTGHIDTGSLSGVFYEYRIRAVGAASNSSWATTTSMLHTNVADVTQGIQSTDGINAEPTAASPGNSYVPAGFTYYDTPIPLVTGQTLSQTLRNNFSAWLGTKITVGATPILVRGLGRWVISGNTGAHTVKLVNVATNAAVPGASVTVNTAGAPVGFKYTDLPVPVTLAANTAYYLVSQEVSGGDQWYEGNSLLTIADGLATTQTAYTGNNVNWTLYNPNCSYGPVSLTYSLVPVPFITSHSMTTLRNNHTGWLGMEIGVGASAIPVAQLGRWVVSGNTGVHAVKLVDATTGTEVASATVDTLGATAGQFKYATLASPVTLAANTRYYLLSHETAGGDQWYDYAMPASGTATGYQTWLLANGLPMDASGTGGASATPANDGLPNLLKYALGLSPDINGDEGRLVYGQVTDNGSNYLSLTYTRPEPAPSGITYTVESSPDLSPGSWTAAGLVQTGSLVNSGLRTITVRDSSPISTRRFMRLKISQP